MERKLQMKWQTIFILLTIFLYTSSSAPNAEPASAQEHGHQAEAAIHIPVIPTQHVSLVVANPVNTGSNVAVNPVNTGTNVAANPVNTGTNVAANPVNTGTNVAANPVNTGTNVAVNPGAVPQKPETSVSVVVAVANDPASVSISVDHSGGGGSAHVSQAPSVHPVVHGTTTLRTILAGSLSGSPLGSQAGSSSGSQAGSTQGSSSTGAGSSGESSETRDPTLAGVLCYEDSPQVVQRNLPCNEKQLRKSDLTAQHLARLLRDEGGNIISDLMSAEPPGHLRLSGLENSPWFNQNSAELISKLGNVLYRLREHHHHLRQNVRQYLSLVSLTDISSLALSVLDTMSSTFGANVCPVNTSLKVLNEFDVHSLTYSCVQLAREAENLTFVGSQFKKHLSRNEYLSNTRTNQLNNQATTNYNTDNNVNNFNNTMYDEAIDDLLETVNTVKERSNHIVELHHLLQDTVSGFQSSLSLLKTGLHQVLNNGNLPGSEASNEIPTQNKSSDDQYLSSTWNASAEDIIVRYNLTWLQQDLKQNITEVIGSLQALIASVNYLEELLSSANVTEPVQDPLLDTMANWNQMKSRTKRSATGITVSGESCQRQGSLIDQTNYVSLCTTCVHTTVLDNNYFPRYLTEKICGHGRNTNPNFQDGCLFTPGQTTIAPGGLCQQQQFHIILLRRVPGRCMKISSRGLVFITDQWESATYPLRIGCECVVNQNSQFARYA